MSKLYIDIETYSSEDIKLGVHKYVDSKDFRIMLIAYAVDDEPVRVIDLEHGDDVDYLLNYMQSEDITIVAHNSEFERICLNKFFDDLDLTPFVMYDTAANAAVWGYPRSLAELGKALKLPASQLKMGEGKQLINIYCKPHRDNKLASDENWKLFKEYVKRDVEVMRNCDKKMKEMPLTEQLIHTVNNIVNDEGIAVSEQLVDKLIETRDDNNLNYKIVLPDGTEVNHNSAKQVLFQANEVCGLGMKSFTIEEVKRVHKELSQRKSISAKENLVLQLLEARINTSLASLKKLDAIKQRIVNGRVHDAFYYFGASTGRFAGRGVQLQNLPRGGDIQDALSKIKNGTATNEDLKSLVRPCFTADTGQVLAISDFSAIEARVLAWLAGEQWVLDTFKANKDIYKQTAAKSFNLKYEEITKNQRQQGKVQVLALGYGGSVGAMERMDFNNSIQPDQYQRLVDLWRKTNPKIVQFWSDLDRACKLALSDQKVHKVGQFLQVKAQGSDLGIRLPSGRILCYRECKVTSEGLEYTRQTEKGIQKVRAWAGILTENVTQAVARDILCEAILRIYQNLCRDDGKFKIVGHVHDEVIVSSPEGQAKEVHDIMNEQCKWAPGLPLKAETEVSKYYKK